jgi:hypothetical protein
MALPLRCVVRVVALVIPPEGYGWTRTFIGKQARLVRQIMDGYSY